MNEEQQKDGTEEEQEQEGRAFMKGAMKIAYFLILIIVLIGIGISFLIKR